MGYTSMRARLAVAVAATLWHSVLVGCRGDHRAVETRRYRLQIERVVAPGGEALGDVVRDAVARALPGTEWFAVDGAQTLPARIVVAELTAADRVEVLRVELVVDASPGPNGGLEELSATVEVAPVGGTVERAADLPLALAKAVAVLDARITLAQGEGSAKERLLRSSDPQILVMALDWVAAHRARALADSVATLAEHRDERVALRAIECLGIVGGPEHARALVRRPRIGDEAYARRLYEALSRLGGEDATGFLEFAARNEDDPALASTARRALQRSQPAPRPLGARAPRTARGHRGGGRDT